MRGTVEHRTERDHKPELKDEVKFTLEEGRMTLPGIQALFGFQLIAVFSDAFSIKVGPHEKFVHLAAIYLTMVAIGLTMAPAAFDRQTKDSTCTARFIGLASRFITAGMVPLCISMSLDLYIITLLITAHEAMALTLSIGALAFLGTVWFLLPFMHNIKNRPREIQGL